MQNHRPTELEAMVENSSGDSGERADPHRHRANRSTGSVSDGERANPDHFRRESR